MNGAQKYMLKIAGFDDFIAKYSFTQINTISSIGIFFIFQYLAIFTSFSILFFEFIYSNIFISIFFGFLFMYLFVRLTKYLLSKLQNGFKINVLLNISFVNTLILFIVSMIFTLKIFQNEIYYDLILNGNSYGNFKIKKHILSLLYQIKSSENGIIILLFSIALFLLFQFIFIKPYFQIYAIRKTLYYTIKKGYEQKFKKTNRNI